MKVSQKLILKTIEESGVGFSNAKTHDEIKEKINTYGYGDEKLDDPLHEHVDRAAVVSGDATHDTAEHEAQRYTDQPHRE